MNKEARRSLERLIPRLQSRVFRSVSETESEPFFKRLDRHFEEIFNCLLHLYGERYDFFYHLEEILTTTAELWRIRPADLKALDAAREADPLWYQSERMLAGVCYVDLFAGDLEGVRKHIPYFKELGLTYLHLMPLFRSPIEENDGGYAISSYREVDPRLGSMEELRNLALELRDNEISLVLDFVFNHTSNEHEWAQRALAGDPDYQDYYHMFPDRRMPDAYGAHLREIFPEHRPGSFTYQPEISRWVWTTFRDYQWDLNYTNPAVFDSMVEEMLFLANQGVEVLRMDAVAFTWKKLGTNCENLPEAHILLRAFNAIARVAAPALLFKSEAIVHPDEVEKYIAPDECQLSYNPLLMALLWETLATRDVRLLTHSMTKRLKINPLCAWVNYVRSHDDIGWTFSDEDAAELNIRGFDHRQFLNDFYTGRFKGSFARGLAFQYNPRTRDARVAGTCASLAGLEKALREETATEVDLAIQRILLINSIILVIGGIPLIYLGDEIGTLNDYQYRNDPAKAGDSRWVHRPYADWSRYARRTDPETVEGKIYQQLRQLIEIRKANPVFAGGGAVDVVGMANHHVFGFTRRKDNQRVLILANFTEAQQSIKANELRVHGMGYRFTDLVNGQELVSSQDLVLDPYQFVWLRSVD